VKVKTAKNCDGLKYYGWGWAGVEIV